MFSHSYKEAVKTHQTKVTLWGLLRGAMMFADMDKYFEQSWGNSWTVIRARDVDELGEKYSKESVYRKLNEYGIEVRP